MRYIWIFLLFFTSFLYSNTIQLTESTNNLNITKGLYIYIDKDSTKSFEEIKELNDFKPHSRDFLDFGYIVFSTVWVKVTFENNSNKDIEKLLSYSDVLVSKYFLYSEDGKLLGEQGVHNRAPTLKNLQNFFLLNIPAQSKKTFYIYLSTKYSSTHGMFQIWNEKTFFQEESLHIILLTCFFSAMSILALYNLFLFFFSKDSVYFYYVLYLFVLIFQQFITVGYLYTLISVESRFIYENWLFTMIIVNLIYITIIPFTKKFLNTKQYPKINFILNIYFWLLTLSIPIFYISNNFTFYDWIVNFVYSEVAFLIFTGWYTLYKGNFNARYYVIGWGFLVIVALSLMTLHFIGVYPFLYKFPYFVEIMLLSEALLFSVALVHKLKRLQNEIITRQHTEKTRLQKEVDKKTEHLNSLLKELHHRVKNNMQVIISMIRMQYNKIDEKETKEKFIEIENRIDAMSIVHGLLYDGDMLDNKNTKYYFETLIEHIQNSLVVEHEIDVKIECECKFKMDKAIYLGLIINELVYNSIKYAFNTKEIGSINIKLEKVDETYKLSVVDNGKGIENINKKNTLGLKLVETLAKDQLNGEITISSNKGTKVEVVFK